jgi:hypothetical protein
VVVQTFFFVGIHKEIASPIARVCIEVYICRLPFASQKHDRPAETRSAKFNRGGFLAAYPMLVGPGIDSGKEHVKRTRRGLLLQIESS